MYATLAVTYFLMVIKYEATPCMPNPPTNIMPTNIV